ncbi:hypothetical protein CRUP_013473 [Coryphaenoides rupestris]|nr:hypothetical protein CRUP_013473 [Coryphaenoides rupestris]
MVPMVCVLSLLCAVSALWLTDVDGQPFSNAITNITVDYGEDGVFNCALASGAARKQVVQVTLQKRSSTPRSDGTFSESTSIGAYSERFGKKIHDPYRGRVDWSEFPSVSAPGITIHNVTWSDEAFYICTFNIFPTGSESQTIFFSVQGISNVTTDVKQIQAQTGELVVVCSATGRPPPVVHWDAGTDLSRETSVWTEENDDHTFTVSSNLTLTAGLLPPSMNFVYCVVDHGTGSTATGSRRERISLPQWPGEGDTESGNKSGSSAATIVAVIVGLLVGCILLIAAIVKFWKAGLKMKSNNTAEEVEVVSF